MRALTIRQPWASAIAYGDKRVENRGWALPEKLRGQVIAIHAGKGHDLYAQLPEGCAWPEIAVHPLGAVIAVARVTHSCLPWECDGSCSPWAIRGQDHWHLEDVIALRETVPCTGHLGVWPLLQRDEKTVRAQLEDSNGQ